MSELHAPRGPWIACPSPEAEALARIATALEAIADAAQKLAKSDARPGTADSDVNVIWEAMQRRAAMMDMLKASGEHVRGLGWDDVAGVRVPNVYDPIGFTDAELEEASRKAWVHTVAEGRAITRSNPFDPSNWGIGP